MPTLYDPRRLLAKAEQRNLLLHHCRTNGIQLPDSLTADPERFPTRLDRGHRLHYSMEIPASEEERRLLAQAEQLHAILRHCTMNGVQLDANLLNLKPRLQLEDLPKKITDKIAAEVLKRVFHNDDEHSAFGQPYSLLYNWRGYNGRPALFSPSPRYGFELWALSHRAAFEQFFKFFRIHIKYADVMSMTHRFGGQITLGRQPVVRFRPERIQKLRIDTDIPFSCGICMGLEKLLNLHNSIENLPADLPELQDLILEVQFSIENDYVRHYKLNYDKNTENVFPKLYFDLLLAFFELEVPIKTLMRRNVGRSFVGSTFEEVIMPFTAPVALPEEFVPRTGTRTDDHLESIMDLLYQQWKESRSVEMEEDE
ncbi:hypothetical protein Q7P37_002345 [Cladosporium fusiforme]